ncbi:Regulator of chromosome condensation (RCC1) repeat protein [compost metagenome]
MVQVGSLTDWKELAPSLDFTLALKNDGTLWSWGGNLYGQLGLGDTISQSSPVQIGKSLWSEISTQGTWAAAIRK